MRRSSFALRAAALSGTVMLVFALLGSGWAFWRGEQALRQQLDLTIAGEAEAFAREYEELGLGALAVAVDSHARRRGPMQVVLLGPAGQRLAGFLPGAPVGLQGFATLESPRRRALGARLPGGATLVLATDLSATDRAAAALAVVPPLAGGIAALLALALGFLAAARMETRLAEANLAARAIMDGDLSRRLPVATPTDEMGRLSVTVNVLLARIEALVAAQRQVTDDIAHELRAPLSRLRQNLESGGAREDAIAELDSVLAQFASLLRIARAESGALAAGFKPVDLSALCRDMADTFGAVAEDAGKALESRIADGVTLHGDAALLRQSIANLLENAITHGGARIAFALEPGPVVTVADDGPGIPPGERQAVLRRFHRLDRSRATPGTGLGLALVAAAAAAHGGRVRMEDAAPGTRAVMELHA